MYSQEQLVEKRIEIGHWPTFERLPSQHKHRKTTHGDMIGMVYDTREWPVPGEVYHPDNRRKWHCDDPNRPAPTQEEMEYERKAYESNEHNRREAASIIRNQCRCLKKPLRSGKFPCSSVLQESMYSRKSEYNPL